MSRSNEPGFTIGNFFKIGSFRPEDKAVLESVCSDDNAVPLAQLPKTAAENLIAMPTNPAKLDTNAWVSEFTMDVVLSWLQSKYPTVYFIQSMLWSNPMAHVKPKLVRDLDKLRAKRYFASCICRGDHWYWLLYDTETEILLYGDNYNGAADNHDLKLCIHSMVLYIRGILSVTKLRQPVWHAVQCPEFTDDINNCGAYAILFLLMALESDCELANLNLLFGMGWVKQENMPFLRYRLAMCIALQTLEVPVECFESIELGDNIVPFDPFLTPILEFDQNFFEKQEETTIQPEEWAAAIVVADLTLPEPLAEPKVWILYFIGIKPGISGHDLVALCDEKGIDKAAVYYHVNIAWRHNESHEKIAKANRIVRQHNGLYYATVAALTIFTGCGLSYSRYDYLTLKKKTVRRTGRKKATQLFLEDGDKKTRPYQKSGHTIPWKQIICELTCDFVIPMTSAAIKLLYRRKYPESKVLKLSAQKITLRILQAIESLKVDKKRRGRNQPPVSERSSSLKLQREVAEVVRIDSILSVIYAMSANLRAACVEYFRFSNTQGLTFFDGDFVNLNDMTNFHDILRRANLAHNINVIRATEYADYLKNEVESRERRLQFIEFIIRVAITKDLESKSHFKTLFFASESVIIKFVTADYTCIKRPDASKSKKKKKDDPCSKYLISLKYILYANQCNFNANPALNWEKLTAYADAQERLVCTLENHHRLLAVDLEGYLILCEPIYYGSLIEVPTEDFENWFLRVNHHVDPIGYNCHATYIKLYNKEYLECKYNLKAGMRFFHNL